MNVSLEKITAPVAFVIVGFIMIVIGSTGVVPIINQPVASSSGLFIFIGIILVLSALLFVWREQVGQKSPSSASEVDQSLGRKQVGTRYEIKITSPLRGHVFKGGAGDMAVSVAGTCRPKPPLGTTLRLFVRTSYGYWRQDALVDIDNDGYWTSQIGLWRADHDLGYDAYVIAAVLDEPGEDMVRFSKKVHEEGKVNISFNKLPHYLDKSEELHTRRE